jgi:hypothetical protein
MKITLAHFTNGGGVDCCILRTEKPLEEGGNPPMGRLSIRAAPVKGIASVAVYEAYCHEFTPGKRESKDVVLKRGTLAEVVAFTNEQCGLEDTVEEAEVNTMYADEDLRSSVAEEPSTENEPLDADAGGAPKLPEDTLAEERMNRVWW